MKLRTVGVLACLVLGSVAGCGGGGDDTSGEDTAAGFITDVFELLDEGRFEEAWQDLHPAHQELVPLDDYVRCGQEGGSISIEVNSAEEGDPVELTLPGTELMVDAVPVTVDFTARQGLIEDTDRDTFRAIDVDGEWRFSLSDPLGYSDGNCP